MNQTLGLAVNTIYQISRKDIPAFAELSRNLVLAGRASSGCVYFYVAQDIEDSSQFHLLEGWTDQAALDSFNQSETFRALLKEAMGLEVLDRLRAEVSDCAKAYKHFRKAAPARVAVERRYVRRVVTLPPSSLSGKADHCLGSQKRDVLSLSAKAWVTMSKNKNFGARPIG